MRAHGITVAGPIDTACRASRSRVGLFRPLLLPLCFLASLATLALVFVLARPLFTHVAAARDHITSPSGIERQAFVDVNGDREWMVVRGQDTANPLILFLHGGPGSPESIMASCRYQGEIEKHYTVVHWEQRGAGKSYSAALEKTGVTFDDCVDDVLAVTRLLLARYGKHKLFLIGHSWGSLIGVAAISRHPEYYDAYLGVGQIVNVVQQEKLSRKCALAYLAAHGPRADLNRLRSIGEPPYADALRSIALERKFLLRAGGVFGPGYSPGRMSWDLWTCPYYSLLDLWRLGKGASFCQSRLITSEHWDVRLDTTNTVFEIPVFFVMGDRDCNTPYVLARRYYERIRAPQKEFVTIEGAAHMLNFERPLRFNQEVVRLFSQVPR